MTISFQTQICIIAEISVIMGKHYLYIFNFQLVKETLLKCYSYHMEEKQKFIFHDSFR